jgi:hypothetical protein
MNDEIAAYFAGVVSGLIILGLLMTWEGTMPEQVRQKYETQAISLGYATNVIILDEKGQYSLKFQWITNK